MVSGGIRGRSGPSHRSCCVVWGLGRVSLESPAVDYSGCQVGDLGWQCENLHRGSLESGWLGALRVAPWLL